MGTHPVLRDISAAAPAVAMPAMETLREVCWLFGEGLSAPGVPGLAWEGAICGLLLFLFVGGVRVLIFPVLLALQPKATLLQGPRGPCWH